MSVEDPDQLDQIKNLKVHVYGLAENIGPRNAYESENLEKAKKYIYQAWTRQGYEVVEKIYLVPDNFCSQFGISTRFREGLNVSNLRLRIKGTKDPDKIIVLGAHYDTVKDCPGANDNASAIAVLLEVSRKLKESKPNKTIDLFAYTNEEPPFFNSDLRGSYRAALSSIANKENIIAMIALDTIGSYSDQIGSQKAPFPLNLYYGNIGNFLAFVSNLRSIRLTRTAIREFRLGTDLLARQLSLPSSLIPQIGFSDHSSYWRVGYPAFLITDTAMFRYPHYHRITDTSDKLDYHRLSQVTDGVVSILQKLAA